MLIIGIAGKMGVGKDYVSLQLKQLILKHNPNATVRLITFGDQLKVTCSVSQNLPIEIMFGDKPQYIRELLQQTATELGRNVSGQDIWIKYLNAWLNVYNIRETMDVVIIPDVRFKNEYEWILSKSGYVIYINAPNRNMTRLLHESDSEEIRKKIANHRSETELNDYKHQYIISNDDNLNLINELETIFK